MVYTKEHISYDKIINGMFLEFSETKTLLFTELRNLFSLFRASQSLKTQIFKLRIVKELIAASTVHIMLKIGIKHHCMGLDKTFINFQNLIFLPDFGDQSPKIGKNEHLLDLGPPIIVKKTPM